MSRIFAVFLLLVVLAIGGSAIAASAYQAGLTTAVAQVPADGGTVVTPVVVQGYGWGFPGFGIFGFFATLFFIFLVFGLMRAIFWGGRGHRHGWGPDGPDWGPGGPGGPGRGWDQEGSPWRDRAHGTFETWHREAHASGEGDGAPGSAATPPAPPTAPA